jgi:phytoene dehydrogenase-like protein
MSNQNNEGGNRSFTSIKYNQYNEQQPQQTEDIVVIGAGIAGLTAAIYLAREGRSVTVFEQSSTVGGRARTLHTNGFYFNQGPHALYLSGAGAKILEEIGVRYTGKPPPMPQYLVKDNVMYPQIGGLRSLLTTKLLKGIKSKIEAIGFFTSLKKMDFTKIQNITLQHWLNKNIESIELAELIATLCRVATYANNPDTQSAGTALGQLQLAASAGVLYLDNGWQTIVNGLMTEAKKAKVKIITGKRIVNIKELGEEQRKKQTELNYSDTRLQILLSDGNIVITSKLIIAASPNVVYDLFKDKKIQVVSDIHIKEIEPVMASCLDIALSSLPHPDRPVAFSIDKPLYLSVHSMTAKLTPGKNNGELVHVMKYQSAFERPDPENDKLELEHFLDIVQPGWRKLVIKKRFLPNMVVYNALVTAAKGGLKGRPNIKLQNLENVYIVGDWIGQEGLLADASFASAKHAAMEILNEKKTNAIVQLKNIYNIGRISN